MHMKRLYKILAVVTLSFTTSLAAYAWGEGFSQESELSAIEQTSCVSEGETCYIIYYYSTYCVFGGDLGFCAGGAFQEYYTGTCYWPVPEATNVYYCIE